MYSTIAATTLAAAASASAGYGRQDGYGRTEGYGHQVDRAVYSPATDFEFKGETEDKAKDFENHNDFDGNGDFENKARDFENEHEINQRLDFEDAAKDIRSNDKEVTIGYGQDSYGKRTGFNASALDRKGDFGRDYSYGQDRSYGQDSYGERDLFAGKDSRDSYGQDSYGKDSYAPIKEERSYGQDSYAPIKEERSYGIEDKSFGGYGQDSYGARFGGRVSSFGGDISSRFGQQSFGKSLGGYGQDSYGVEEKSIGGYGQDSYGQDSYGQDSYGVEERSYGAPAKEERSYRAPAKEVGYGKSHGGYGQVDYKHHVASYGPFSYRKPKVDYKVAGPGPKLGVYGPKAKLGVDRAELSYKSKRGSLGVYGPNVGNKFQRPDIKAFRPKFGFSAPKLNFRQGVAKTQRPETSYYAPKIQQTYDAPRYDLHKPRAQAQVAGPKPWLDVNGPSADLSVHRPRTHYARSSPVAYVKPAKKSYKSVSYKRVEQPKYERRW